MSWLAAVFHRLLTHLTHFSPSDKVCEKKPVLLLIIAPGFYRSPEAHAVNMVITAEWSSILIFFLLFRSCGIQIQAYYLLTGYWWTYYDRERWYFQIFHSWLVMDCQYFGGGDKLRAVCFIGLGARANRCIDTEVVLAPSVSQPISSRCLVNHGKQQQQQPACWPRRLRLIAHAYKKRDACTGRVSVRSGSHRRAERCSRAGTVSVFSPSCERADNGLICIILTRGLDCTLPLSHSTLWSAK